MNIDQKLESDINWNGMNNLNNMVYCFHTRYLHLDSRICNDDLNINLLLETSIGKMNRHLSLLLSPLANSLCKKYLHAACAIHIIVHVTSLFSVFTKQPTYLT